MLKKINSLLVSVLLSAQALTSNATEQIIRDPLPAGIQRMPDEAIFSSLKPNIRRHLSEGERRAFDQIHFSFPSTANYLHVATTKLENGKRLAEISKGFLLLNQGLSFGLYEAALLEPERSFSSYLSFMASRVGQDTLRYENGGPLPTYPLYGQWAQIPKADSDAIETKYRNKLLDTYTATLLYAVLHETAHHINKDLDRLHNQVSDSALRDQEHKADLFAFVKMRSMGYPPSSVAPFFLLMTVLEGDVNQITGSHDPSICRLANIGTSLEGSKNAAGDPDQEMFRQILMRCNRQ